IPAVIRNAERLGIYGRYAIEEKAKGAEVAKDLTELIGKMIKGKTETFHKKPANKRANPKCNSDEPCAPEVENQVDNVKYPILDPNARRADNMRAEVFGLSGRQLYRFGNMLVLPPISSNNGSEECGNQPDRAEILRNLSRVTGGVPNIYSVFRDDITYKV